MDDGMIGEIRLFAGNFAPRSWAFCDGQLLAISSNDALFSILGTTYGGDGRTTFALPDLRGRVASGTGQGPGLSNTNLGQKKGTENETLNATQLPSHTHGVGDASWKPKAIAAAGSTDVAVGNVFARAEDAAGTKNIYATTALYDGDPDDQVTMVPPVISVDAVSTTGGSASLPNRQPYLGLRYIICLFGTYPSRS